MEKEKRITDPYLDRRSGDDRRDAYELGFFVQGGIERRRYVDRRSHERRDVNFFYAQKEGG